MERKETRKGGKGKKEGKNIQRKVERIEGRKRNIMEE